MSDLELIVFDLDDTLIDTSHVYWTARQSFIQSLAQRGVDETYALELFETIDEKNMKAMGLVPERYERTMLDSYAFLVDEGRVTRQEALEAEIRTQGQIVPTQLPELIAGAKLLLEWASTRFFTVLMTRGVEPLQKKKIAYSEISQYFKDIQIVAKKDASHFAALIAQHGFTPSTTWVIGDSIRSDINPALSVGARTILYQYTHHSYYWRQEYGEVPTKPFFRITGLEQAIPILEGKDTGSMTTPEEWAKLIAIRAE